MNRMLLVITCLMLNMISYGYNMDRQEDLKWSKLISEGSNYLVRAQRPLSGEHRKKLAYKPVEEYLATEHMERWFCELVDYSIPTNDLLRYADMLRVKSKMIYLTAWRMDSEKSWVKLANFYAEVIKKRTPLTIDRREELKKKFVSEKNNMGFKEFAELKKTLRHESFRQSELENSVRNTAKAIERIADRLTCERKSRLATIVKEITGRYPKWYQKELEEKLKAQSQDLQ